MQAGVRTMTCALFALSTAMGFQHDASAQVQLAPDGMVGLEHIPFLVQDLEQSTEFWRKIGFSPSPVEPRDNGIRASLIRFEDGSGIELLTVAEAIDELTTQYRELITQADGPAYFGLHARDAGKLTTKLGQQRYRLNNDDGVVTIDSRHLDYLFITTDDSRDDSFYLKHPNGSYAMVRVWISTNRSEELADLLVALGGELSSRWVYVPDRVPSKVVTVNNGEVLILPARQQLTEDREVIGATFEVSDLAALEKRLTISNIPFIKGGSGNASVVIAPTETHGMWLEFRE